MAREKGRRKRRREENKALEIHHFFFFFFFFLPYPELPNFQLVQYSERGSQRAGRGNKQYNYGGRIILLKSTSRVTLCWIPRHDAL